MTSGLVQWGIASGMKSRKARTVSEHRNRAPPTVTIGWQRAALALRRAACPAIALGDDRGRVARGSAVLHGGRDESRAHALGDRLAHDEHPVEPVDAHAHLVAGLDGLCRLRALAADADMPRPAGGRRGRPGLVDADGPEPGIHSRGGAHGVATTGAVGAIVRVRRAAIVPAAMSP